MLVITLIGVVLWIIALLVSAFWVGASIKQESYINVLGFLGVVVGGALVGYGQLHMHWFWACLAGAIIGFFSFFVARPIGSTP